jgi:murein DD-endopeptidase MepM/ murein hydrolase activator NlpD
MVADGATPSPQADESAPAEPSARPARHAQSARTRPSASPRTTGTTRAAAKPTAATSRRQQAELKHALWADRQLAAMLRATPVTSLWFGGATWTTPVAAYHLTARFGETSSLWATIHTGLDFAAPTGTPVRAATAGTVTFVGWAGAYGNKIEITHPDGTETWYAHLSRTDVRVGSQVGTGAVIGAVGATGNVTGSHLHFEVRPGGDDPVDPAVALQEHGIRP